MLTHLKDRPARSVFVLLLGIVLLLGCARDERRYVIDCREAATKLAARYPGWQTQFHYNIKDRKCYLSLEGSEAASDQDGVRHYVTTELVKAVDENRDVLACTSAWQSGQSQSWLCNGPSGESISHDRFSELRAKFLKE